MDAMMMKCLANLCGDGHKVVIFGCKNVDGGDDLGFGELPDVQFVEGQDAFDLENRIADAVKGNMGRDTLEEDERSAADCEDGDERDRGVESGLPKGSALENMMMVMTRLMMGSQ